jgi:hypothetical protein
LNKVSERNKLSPNLVIYKIVFDAFNKEKTKGTK